MTKAKLIAAIFLVAFGTSCTQFPELDETFTRDARSSPFPQLGPAEDLRAQVGEALITDESIARTEARINALKARAARLRGTVIDQNSRNRLSQQPQVAVAN
ncbi:MAG: hypothetical protein AAGF53_13240 [Pseudomonadota bacterium]